MLEKMIWLWFLWKVLWFSLLLLCIGFLSCLWVSRVC